MFVLARSAARALLLAGCCARAAALNARHVRRRLSGPAFSTSFSGSLDAAGQAHAVHLPLVGTPEADRLGAPHVDELHPIERLLLDGMAPPRRDTWAGGRIALRRALREIGSAEAEQPILQGDSGAPLVVGGAVGSISHTDGLAAAVACREPAGSARVAVGVDVERAGREISPRAARRILCDEERRSLGEDEARGLSAAEDLLLRFCLKEALYKALHPLLARAIPWHSVRVYPRADGSCAVELAAELATGARASLRAQARWQRHGEYFMASARADQQLET